MINFVWPWVFLLLPAAFLIYFLSKPLVVSQAALPLPYFAQLSALNMLFDKTKPRFRIILLFVIWVLLIVASARPQWLGDPISQSISGRDLMLAIDVSASMQADDMLYRNQTETRLQSVKRIVGDFIQRRAGDRIGLILFGTHPYLQSPLSYDRKTINQFLQESTIGIAGKHTAIGDAVGLAIKRMRKDQKESISAPKDSVLILVTDGANTSGVIQPLQAAQLAKTVAMKIYTIGIGAEKAQVNGFFGKQLINPSADLDEHTLQQMSNITEGESYRAQDVESLDNIIKEIEKLEPINEEKKHFRPKHELFYIPLFAASMIALLLTVYHGVFQVYRTKNPA